MAASPQYAAAPVLPAVAVSTANTNRDGTGAMGSVLTGGGSGTLLHGVQVQAVGTTTAGMVRLFVDSGGTVTLLHEIAIAAITPTATVKAFAAYLPLPEGFTIPAGVILKATTHNAESFVVRAVGADL